MDQTFVAETLRQLVRAPLTIAASAMLMACATVPVSNTGATPAPADRILDREWMQPRPGAVSVVLKRDSGAMGSMCSVRMYVDGRPIVDIRQGEKIELQLPVGEHIFSAQPNGICAGGMSEIKATLVAGRSANFRVGYGTNGDFGVFQTAF